VFLLLSLWYIAELKLQLLPEVCWRLLRYRSVCVCVLCVFVEQTVIEVYEQTVIEENGSHGQREHLCISDQTEGTQG